ncbi:hypothetical protein ABID62_002886 [Bradyrhizobium sp. S3.9.1]
MVSKTADCLPTSARFFEIQGRKSRMVGEFRFDLHTRLKLNIEWSLKRADFVAKVGCNRRMSFGHSKADRL